MTATPARNEGIRDRVMVRRNGEDICHGPSLLPMLIADIEAGCHRRTTNEVEKES